MRHIFSHFIDEDPGAQRLKVTQSHMGSEELTRHLNVALTPKTPKLSECILVRQCLPPPLSCTHHHPQPFYM